MKSYSFERDATTYGSAGFSKMIDRLILNWNFYLFGYTHQQQVNYVDSFERNELDDMLNSNTRRTNVVIFSLLVKIKKKKIKSWAIFVS